jgi:hypothetical protein
LGLIRKAPGGGEGVDEGGSSADLEAEATDEAGSVAQNFAPSLARYRLEVSQRMVDQIVRAIYMIDITIESWNELLKKAQPHRPKRLVFRFSPADKVNLGQQPAWDVAPVAGRMMRSLSGGWRFQKLSPRTPYRHLRDLRVGQSLKSDPLVVRLINGIEELLVKRAELHAFLVTLSRGMPGKLAGIYALCEKRQLEALDLQDRIKLDWSLGAARAEEILREQRRARYDRSKEAQPFVAGSSPLDEL